MFSDLTLGFLDFLSHTGIKQNGGIASLESYRAKTTLWNENDCSVDGSNNKREDLSAAFSSGGFMHSLVEYTVTFSYLSLNDMESKSVSTDHEYRLKVCAQIS